MKLRSVWASMVFLVSASAFGAPDANVVKFVEDIQTKVAGIAIGNGEVPGQNGTRGCTNLRLVIVGDYLQFSGLDNTGVSFSNSYSVQEGTVKIVARNKPPMIKLVHPNVVGGFVTNVTDWAFFKVYGTDQQIVDFSDKPGLTKCNDVDYATMQSKAESLASSVWNMTKEIAGVASDKVVEFTVQQSAVASDYFSKLWKDIAP